MEIKKIKLQTVLLNTDDIKQKYPELIPAIMSYISNKKPVKKKPRKKIMAADLIDKIIASLE